MMSMSPAILVFSHLQWDFVHQRPQHLMARFAAYRRVLFIEEPEPDVTAQQAYWEFSDPLPNVRVCRPRTPVEESGFCDAQIAAMRPLVAALLAAEQVENYVAWFYTPMACPLLEDLAPQAVIYDCMDDLSSFRFAPPQLAQREASLTAAADLVFTGGPSLYRARLGRHAHLYCFPSSVEVEHFHQARPGAPDRLPEPPDQAALPHPRLGFYGVIDERMDLALLDALARTHPEWQIVLIGPTAKIDPAVLPLHPNLHYLGKRSYAELPAYMSGWDVCLLPFARNAATRFISPTKILEYMAAERMIVSTPIADVAEPYGDIVYLGDSGDAFTTACERALQATPAERARRIGRMRQVLSRTSWNTTARAMEYLIERAMERRRAGWSRPMSVDTTAWSEQNLTSL